MALDSLRQLFLKELRDIYDAEHQILDALPKMKESASTQALQGAFSDHREQTQGHVERLEEVFGRFDVDPERETCEGVKGLIEEGEEIVEAQAEPATKDAALIAGAQRVEHYEMAAYGTLRTWAEHLGDEKSVQLLQGILQEESETDDRLTRLAVDQVNQMAA